MGHIFNYVKYINGVWLSLARVPDLGSGGRRFESCHPDLYGSLAQSVEHLTFNQVVPGSNPGWLSSAYFPYFIR